MATAVAQRIAQASAWKPKGYPRLARLMGRSRDVAIFRRFEELNLLSLLSLQAEVAALRTEFWSSCQADDLAGPPSDMISLKFQSQREENAEQYAILLKIRNKMKEYNELLLQESLLYAPQFEHDLLTFSQFSKPVLEHDAFAYLLRKKLFNWYHVCIGRHRDNKARIVDEESGTVKYEESKLNRGINVMATVLSSVLPIVAIVILNHFRSTQTRIYVAVGITATFAFILACVTDARRVEVFAATATFAAVEVVFIGTVAEGTPSS